MAPAQERKIYARRAHPLRALFAQTVVPNSPDKTHICAEPRRGDGLQRTLAAVHRLLITPANNGLARHRRTLSVNQNPRRVTAHDDNPLCHKNWTRIDTDLRRMKSVFSRVHLCPHLTHSQG